MVELLDNLGCNGCDIGLRVTLQHVLDGFLELLVILLGEIAQGINEHELGHNLGQRILAHHLGVGLVYCTVVVGQIVGVGLFIHVLLIAVHVLEVLQIVGILHGHAVLGFREVDKNTVAVRLCILFLSVAHVHHVHIIIHIQTVSVVGVQSQQLVELVGCSAIVLHLVLEDGAHVVETLLDDLV